MIERFQTKELIKQVDNFPVVGIIGPRQCGKTTLAKYIIPFLKKECIYLDLENPADLLLLSDPGLFFDNNSDKCIILDEIQKKQELFDIIRSYVDKKRMPGRFIILGSANPHLLKKSTESLAGRIYYLELSPFNYLEIKNSVSLQEHWFKGGFPESLLSDNDKSKDWLKSFIFTYIERDLPMFGLDTNPETLTKFLIFLSNSQGSLWNATAFTKNLGVSNTTLSNFLNYFNYSYSINKLYPFHANVKKRFVKSPKIYIRDSGILHFLCSIDSFADLERKNFIGKSWEGYVIEQIFQLKNSNIQLFFYRTHDCSECDLVFVKSSTPVAIAEIKYNSAPKISRGFTISGNDLNTEKGFIITPDSRDFEIRKNITLCNLTDFLTKYLPEIK